MNLIYQGDILELLETRVNNSVDMVFTDPPFNDGIDYGVSKDNRGDYWIWVTKWISEYRRISNNRMAILVRNDKLTKFVEILRLSDTELILIDCQHTWFGLLITGDLSIKTERKQWSHQNEDFFTFDKVKYKNPGLTSLRLVERIVKTYSEENDVILDGFMGCGTTAVACKNLNRNFIGIELNPEYIKIANRRLKGNNHGN